MALTLPIGILVSCSASLCSKSQANTFNTISASKPLGSTWCGSTSFHSLSALKWTFPAGRDIGRCKLTGERCLSQEGVRMSGRWSQPLVTSQYPRRQQQIVTVTSVTSTSSSWGHCIGLEWELAWANTTTMQSENACLAHLPSKQSGNRIRAHKNLSHCPYPRYWRLSSIMLSFRWAIKCNLIELGGKPLKRTCTVSRKGILHNQICLHNDPHYVQLCWCSCSAKETERPKHAQALVTF